MLPAFSISAKYRRTGSTEDTELSDVRDALKSFAEWSESIGVGTRTSFTNPILQQAHWKMMQEFGRKHGLLGRFRRLFNKEKVSPESDLLDLLASADSVKGHCLGEFPSRDAFLTAALEILGQERDELFAHGRSWRHYLGISRWDRSWSSYWSHLTLYRHDDSELNIIVSLYSTDAYDDHQLRKAGKNAMDKLVGNELFEASPD